MHKKTFLNNYVRANITIPGGELVAEVRLSPLLYTKSAHPKEYTPQRQGFHRSCARVAQRETLRNARNEHNRSETLRLGSQAVEHDPITSRRQRKIRDHRCAKQRLERRSLRCAQRSFQEKTGKTWPL